MQIISKDSVVLNLRKLKTKEDKTLLNGKPIFLRGISIHEENAKSGRANAEELTTAVTRDKNRACIIIWSMANETPISDARNTFIKNLVDHTKSLDNTRLISAALLTQSDSAGFGTINDAIGDYLDIISFNQYLGWYGGKLEDAERYSGKPNTTNLLLSLNLEETPNKAYTEKKMSAGQKNIRNTYTFRT